MKTVRLFGVCLALMLFVKTASRMSRFARAARLMELMFVVNVARFMSRLRRRMETRKSEVGLQEYGRMSRKGSLALLQCYGVA